MCRFNDQIFKLEFGGRGRKGEFGGMALLDGAYKLHGLEV